PGAAATGSGPDIGSPYLTDDLFADQFRLRTADRGGPCLGGPRRTRAGRGGGRTCRRPGRGGRGPTRFFGPPVRGDRATALSGGSQDRPVPGHRGMGRLAVPTTGTGPRPCSGLSPSGEAHHGPSTPPHTSGTGDRRARRAGTVQSRNRRATVDQPGHRGPTHRKRLPQTLRPPHRAIDRWGRTSLNSDEPEGLPGSTCTVRVHPLRQTPGNTSLDHVCPCPFPSPVRTPSSP